MLKHLKICSKSPYKQVDKKTKDVGSWKRIQVHPNSVNFKLFEFNQEQSLAKMVIIDELPFKYVGNEGFKQFISEA